MPQVDVMYGALSRHGQARGRNAQCLAEVASCAADTGFQIRSRTPALCVVNETAHRWIAVRYIAYASEIMHRKYDIASNRAHVVAELVAWATAPQATLTIADGAWVVLKPI